MSARSERTYIAASYNPPVSPSPTLPREGERIRTAPYNPPVSPSPTLPREGERIRTASYNPPVGDVYLIKERFI